MRRVQGHRELAEEDWGDPCAGGSPHQEHLLIVQSVGVWSLGQHVEGCVVERGGGRGPELSVLLFN